MKKKNALSLVLIFVVAFSMLGLAGCGKQDAKEDAKPDTTKEVKKETKKKVKVLTIDEAKKMLEENGFKDTNTAAVQEGLETIIYAKDDIMYSFYVLEDTSLTDVVMEALVEKLDNFLVTNSVSSNSNEIKVDKEEHKDDFELISKNLGTSAYFLIRQDNTFAAGLIKADNVEGLRTDIKFLNDIEKKLGYDDVLSVY